MVARLASAQLEGVQFHPVRINGEKQMELNKTERSLLLYFETCLVDQYGRVEGRRMNAEEIVIAKKWSEEKFIGFGRLKMSTIQGLRGVGKVYTHWVRFSPSAWRTTHKLRRERSHRMLKSHAKKLIGEMV